MPDLILIIIIIVICKFIEHHTCQQKATEALSDIGQLPAYVIKVHVYMYDA